MKHIPETHEQCQREGHCWICDGGLFACTVCKGAEGSLTTDCPGIELDVDIQEEIYGEALDYTEAEGWHYK
jgi:hypothetical protein